MSWKKSSQWLTTLSFCLLIGSLLVFAYLARKPLCIDSKLVEKIDRASDNQVSTAYRCGLYRQVPFQAELAESSRGLSRRLQKLERALEWLGGLERKITITDLANSKNHFRIHDHDLFISEDVLNADGQLEKAILKIWLQERNPRLAFFPQISESLTDLLFYSFSGGLSIKDPRTGINLGEDVESKWPKVLSDLQGYCLSPWRFSESSVLCDKITADSKVKTDLFLETLRPLVSQSLIASLENLSGSERIQWMRNFAKNISNLKPKESIGANTFGEAVVELQNWSQLLSEIPGESSVVQKFAWRFRQQLESRGFGVENGQVLHALVFQDHVSPEMENNLKLTLQQQSQSFSLGLENGEEIILDGKTSLKKALFTEFQASRGIYLNCGVLDLNKLMSLAKRVHRLVYVDACGQNNLKLEGFFSRGSSSFAMQNPDVKFVDFHSQSLLTALKKVPGANPVDAFAFAEQGNQFLKKIGWDKSILDKTAGAYRSKSVIEAVDWYRL